MRRLVLWDVDGTLLVTGAAGREVIVTAVAAALGRDVDGEAHPMGGKTDPQIVREMLELAGADAGRIDAHLAFALQHLQHGLAAAGGRITAEGRVLPGVPELLRRLAAEPGVVQGVLTGNLRANALVKLQAMGLEGWLDLETAAYGSDSHDRTKLVPIALARAEARHGTSPRPEQVWVVGDTPRDHACAAAAGVRCLLVATGPHRIDELRACGADAVLEDLSDTDGVLRLLLG